MKCDIYSSPRKLSRHLEKSKTFSAQFFLGKLKIAHRKSVACRKVFSSVVLDSTVLIWTLGCSERKLLISSNITLGPSVVCTS